MTSLSRGAAPAAARWGLVLAHGRGGSAEDILGLGEALGLPDVALIAPEAPGRSWWPTSFLAPMAEIAPYLEAGLAAMAEAVATLEAQGLPRARIAIAGFSQGGCLALEFAARRPGLGPVFGLSAGLVGTADADAAPAAELYGHSPKQFDYPLGPRGAVFISVHEQDPHIPLRRAEESIAAFRALDAPAHLHTIPGAGHSIPAEAITAMRAALNT